MQVNNLLKRIKNTIKSKKGLTAIELVIGTLVSIVVFAGYLDFLTISNRMQAMSTSMTYLTRTISNQGCLANEPEQTCLINGVGGYDIDYIKNKKFVTSEEIFAQIEAIMKSETIPNTDWEVLINGTKLTRSTQTRLFNFGDEITIDIKIKYRWKNVSNFLPLNLPEQEFRSNQTTRSLYQLRNQGSDNGFQYGN